MPNGGDKNRNSISTVLSDFCGPPLCETNRQSKSNISSIVVDPRIVVISML